MKLRKFIFLLIYKFKENIIILQQNKHNRNAWKVQNQTSNDIYVIQNTKEVRSSNAHENMREIEEYILFSTRVLDALQEMTTHIKNIEARIRRRENIVARITRM